MALRDLLFDINFRGNVTDLLKMDSAVDDVKDNTLEATSNIEGMESATDSLGDTSSKSGNIISDNWVAVTGALVGVSVAAEKVARDNAPLFESIEKVSRSTGLARDELQDLALDMTNVTFPLEDVTSLMETAGQQGLTTADELKDFGNFWDTVGDAIGGSGPALGEAGKALRGMGIAAGEEKEALAAFGYITESTTGNVDEFLTFLDKAGPGLREMGVDIDESAALLGILEKEFGMSGRTARSEFNKAVSESEGDLSVMYEALGISSEMVSEYTDKVSQSGDVIQDYADIHAETYTTTEKLGQKISELGFKYGDTIKMVSNFAPALSAIGPIAGVVGAAQTSMATGMLSKMVPAFTTAIGSAWAFTTALLANPITWMIVGVVALGVAIWAFATDFGGVTTFVKEKFGVATDWLKGSYDKVVGWFSDGVSNFREIGGNIISSFISGFTEKLGALKDTVVSAASNVGDWFKDKLGIASPSKVMIQAGLDTGEGVSVGLEKSMPDIHTTTKGMADSVIQNYNPVVNDPVNSISREHNPTPNTFNSSDQGDFKPTLNIYVTESKDSKETVQALKREWEKLMAQYEKRNKLKLGVANG